MTDRTKGYLDRFKEFAPTSFAVEHKTSVLVLLVIIAIMGVFSYRATPKESFPELPIPMIAVNTMYPGVSGGYREPDHARARRGPETISDIDVLSSTSVEGYSSIVAEFGTGIDLDEALQKVREKVDLAKPDLPADAEEPSIIEFNFSEVPIMQVNLSGEYGLVRLKELGRGPAGPSGADSERAPGRPARWARARGEGRRRPPRLQFYGLGSEDVVDAIRDENVNIAGRLHRRGVGQVPVRVDGEFDDPSVIEDLVVSVSRRPPDLRARHRDGRLRLRRARELRAHGRQRRGHAGRGEARRERTSSRPRRR
jgi:multidrug efflux pump